MPLINQESLTKEKVFKIGLVGLPKSGKTWLAATAPTPFIFDGEDGVSGAIELLKSLGHPEPYGYSFGEHYENDKTTMPTGWLYFKRMVEAFTRQKPFKIDNVEVDPSIYDTVVFDPWTALGGLSWNFATAAYLKDGGKNPYVRYQIYLEEGRWFVEQIKYLHTHCHKNVVVTFHTQDKDTNSSGTVIRRTPYMEGRALSQILLPTFDELWGVEGRDRQGTHTTCLYTRQYHLIDGLGSRHAFEPKIENPNLTNIINEWRMSHVGTPEQ